MKRHLEVVAAVIYENGKYLCTQRSSNQSLALKWEFPGGKLKVDETHEEALTREIKEELDFVIMPKKHLVSVEHEYHDFTITLHAYLCSVAEGKLILREHQDYRWCSLQEMRQLDFADADKPILELLQALGVNTS